MKQRSSCLKKLGIGCGFILIFSFVMIVMMVIGAKVNQPKPQELAEIQTAEPSGVPEGTALNFPENPGVQKPVKLSISMEMGEFKVQPNPDAKGIDIEGSYDRANFDLKTEIKERDDHIDYRITFKSKRSMFGFLAGGKGNIDSDDFPNRLTVLVGTDLHLDLDYKMSMGEANLDLSGLALENLKLDGNMGEVSVLASGANPIPMKKLNAKMSMGEMQIKDFQNFKPEKAKLNGSFGQMTVNNSGNLTSQVDIDAEFKFGECRIYLPKNARIRSQASAFAGESSVTKGEPSVPESEQVAVNLRGSVSFGQFTVRRGTLKTPITRLLSEWIRNDGVEVAREKFLELHQSDPEGYNFSARRMNRLGYQYLRPGTGEIAVEVFKLNVDIHPGYANGWDSLGEGYAYINETQLAIEAYTRALSLDPDNDNAKGQIEALKLSLE